MVQNKHKTSNTSTAQDGEHTQATALSGTISFQNWKTLQRLAAPGGMLSQDANLSTPCILRGKSNGRRTQLQAVPRRIIAPQRGWRLLTGQGSNLTLCRRSSASSSLRGLPGMLPDVRPAAAGLLGWLAAPDLTDAGRIAASGGGAAPAPPCSIQIKAETTSNVRMATAYGADAAYAMTVAQGSKAHQHRQLKWTTTDECSPGLTVGTALQKLCIIPLFLSAPVHAR